VKHWAKERFIPMDVSEGGSKYIATLSNLRPSSFPINDYGNRAQSSLMNDCSFRRGFFSQLTGIMTAPKNLRPDGEKWQTPTYRVSDLIPHDAPIVGQPVTRFQEISTSNPRKGIVTPKFHVSLPVNLGQGFPTMGARDSLWWV
jgi:hypothetical protein